MPRAAADEKSQVVTLPDSYFELVRRFPLTSIRDWDHLKEAETVLHGLLRQNLDAGGEAYLDALTDLVETFETENIPYGPPAPPADVLKEMLYQHRLSQAQLARQIGIAQSTLSAICQGTRMPTLEQAKILGERFRLTPATFLGL
ncbi:helix-turn-helix domain-containing protein [Paludisphaera rhizosphaerae]|uniref:helix-turn-helix domain-containing protein n=1 Tax=Paludisphaera rhizosphaerae TaxID=2711216 RepID=UPI0013ECA671|nr:helix-turn-helix transcriptional regulator [Paludisphaera rhizosphaerae]